MYIVLRTQGKRDDVDYVCVKTFVTKEEAESFCLANTDEEEEKYWSYAEIITDGNTYEIARYKNYTTE